MPKYNCDNDERIRRKLKMLGDITRGVYLDENPHGYRKSKKIHNSKSKYSRKGKNKKPLNYF